MDEGQIVKEAVKEAKIRKSWFLWLVALVILWIVYNGIAQSYLIAPGQGSGQETVTVILKATAGKQMVLDKAIKVKRGTSAFEAMLQADPSLDYTEYSGIGVMVNSINGVSPGEDSFWALYVNGKQSAVGISQIFLEENTLIEWKTEEIESYTD